MLTVGLVASLTGFIVYLPWGNEYPVLQTTSKLLRHYRTGIRQFALDSITCFNFALCLN